MIRAQMGLYRSRVVDWIGEGELGRLGRVSMVREGIAG